MLSYKNCLKR